MSQYFKRDVVYYTCGKFFIYILNTGGGLRYEVNKNTVCVSAYCENPSLRQAQTS
jgi:hypothetical protein